jgi:hypothetical protein
MILRPTPKIIPTKVSPKLPKPIPAIIAFLKSFWLLCKTNKLTGSDNKAYGEATAESLWKIWQIIKTHLGITSDDVLADWGLGAGKMLFAKIFSLFPDMKAIGYEVTNIQQQSPYIGG